MATEVLNNQEKGMLSTYPFPADSRAGTKHAIQVRVELNGKIAYKGKLK